jgi:hypothetical protein
MFGRDTLLDDGAQVDGVIIEAPEYFRGSTDVRGRYKVTVRVRFEDGATVEVERRLHLSCGGHRARRARADRRSRCRFRGHQGTRHRSRRGARRTPAR